MAWSLALTKNQLSEVVRRACSRGPQVISVRSRDAAVVISTADYERLCDRDDPITLPVIAQSPSLACHSVIAAMAAVSARRIRGPSADGEGRRGVARNADAFGG